MKTFTKNELSKFDGNDPDSPVYLAIKGIVFDVSSNRKMYAPGQGYSVFAGKDASKALGKSSLKPEDCVEDYSGLSKDELAVLEKWVDFYKKKYPVIGELIK